MSLKTFLDRFNSTAGGGLCLTKSGLFFQKVDKEVYSKPFVVLTCCGNVEQETVKNVLTYFETFAKFLDAPIAGQLVRKSVGMLESVKSNGEEGQTGVIAEVVAAYQQAGRELATRGKITPRTQKCANRQLLGIPFLDLLMKFRFFKKLALQKADKRTRGVGMRAVCRG